MNNFFEQTILNLISNQEQAIETINNLKNLLSLREWDLINKSLEETRERIIEAIKNSSLKKENNLDFLIAYLSAIDYLKKLPENLIQIIEINNLDKGREVSL